MVSNASDFLKKYLKKAIDILFFCFIMVIIPMNNNHVWRLFIGIITIFLDYS